MKNICITILIFLLSINCIQAQAPDGFNYQAVVRNNNGDLIVNSNVYFKFNIIQGSQTSIPVFTEIHYVPTDDLGQVNVVIGQGTAITGNFSELDWSLGNYYLGIELDSGNGYVAMGTTQLLSVPYALYSNKSGNSSSSPSLPNGTNDGDVLKWDSENQVWKVFPNDVFMGDLQINSYQPSVYSTYVDVGGEIVSDGGNSILSKGVVWSITPNPSIENDNKIVYGSGFGNFSVRISNLIPLTSYYYRSYVTSTSGTVYGQSFYFTTLDILSEISTAPVSNISTNSANSGVVIEENLGSQIIRSGIIWQPNHNDNFSLNDNVYINEQGPGVLQMDNLIRGNLYYVKSFAQNDLGISYGEELSFETLSEPPTVVTFTPSAGTNYIQTGGYVSDDGGSTITTKGVIFGTDENLNIENNIYPLYSCNSGNCTNTEFSRDFADGISPNTTYTVRAFASNKNGYGYGDIYYITTLAGKPEINSIGFDNVTTRSISMSSEIITDNGSEIIDFGVLISESSQELVIDNSNVVVNTEGETSQIGLFNSTFSNLYPDKTYFFRPYAINSIGISYGNIISQKTNYEPYFDFINPNTNSSLTPGAETSIEWMSNLGQKQISLEHWSEGEFVSIITNNSYANSSGISWYIDESFDYSDQHSLKAYDYNLIEFISESENFTVEKIFNLISPNGQSNPFQGSIDLVWQCNFNNKLKVELFKGNTLIYNYGDEVDSIDKLFEASIIDFDIESGEDYRFRVTDLESNNVYVTDFFSIISLQEPEIDSSIVQDFDPVIGKATVSGISIDINGSSLIEKGIVWGEDPDNLTIEGNKITSDTNNAEDFQIDINNISPLQVVYFKSYAINSAGVGYSESKIILTNKLSDHEENIYDIFSLDNGQIWTSNLKMTTFNDGTPLIKVETIEELKTINKAAYTYPENDINNVEKYGVHYNALALIGDHDGDDTTPEKSLIPLGWRAPDQLDFQSLADSYVSSELYSSTETSSTYTGPLNYQQTPTTTYYSPSNSSGFSAVFSGVSHTSQGPNQMLLWSSSLSGARFIGLNVVDECLYSNMSLTLSPNSSDNPDDYVSIWSSWRIYSDHPTCSVGNQSFSSIRLIYDQ